MFKIAIAKKGNEKQIERPLLQEIVVSMLQ